MAIDFRVVDFAMPASILTLHRELERTQWMPDDERRDWQWRRLRGILDHCERRVPAYRRRSRSAGISMADMRSVEDLSQLPILTRAELVRDGPAFRADDAWRYAPRLHRTSGTSGEPLRFLLDRRMNALEFAYYWRYWHWAGYRLGDAFAHLSTTHFFLRGEMDRAFHWQPHLHRLLINSAILSPDKTDELGRALRGHRIRFLKGLPNAVFRLGSCLHEAGVQAPPLAAVFTTGGVLTAGTRRGMQEVFGCGVFDSYGHMERTIAVSNCPEGAYHIHDDYGVFELVDIAPGPEPGTFVGTPVGTSLYNRAMPLVRYRLDDQVVFRPSAPPCPCGRSFPQIEQILGRHEDVIKTPDGRYLTTLFDLPIRASHVRQIQFVQTDTDRLVLRVVPTPSWDHRAADALLADARRLTGPAMKLALEVIRSAECLTDRSGKVRAVVPLVPASTASSELLPPRRV